MFISFISYAQEEQINGEDMLKEEEQKPLFIYDDHGNRDPFWPLVDEKGTLATYNTDFLITDLMLEGIITGTSEQNLAIINGRIVKINDTIGDFTVLDVSDETVLLIKENKKYELKLKKEK